jgi:hypothetical protein
MIGIKETKLELHFERVIEAERKAEIRALAPAAFAIRKTAIELIEVHGGKPAPVGHPVHTRKGAARVAMAYYSSKAEQRAIIGPRYSVLGESLSAHEFGRLFRGYSYRKRPTMGPALKKNLGKIPGGFAAVITGS